MGQRLSKASGSFQLYYLTIQLQSGTSQLYKHRNSPFPSFIFNTSGLRCWPFKLIISHYTRQVQLAVQLLSYTNTWRCSSRFYWHFLDPRQQIQLMTVHPLLTKLSYQLGQPFAQRPVKLRKPFCSNRHVRLQFPNALQWVLPTGLWSAPSRLGLRQDLVWKLVL